jgi:5'-nucleotidase (lipoprotein e(P4) family)
MKYNACLKAVAIVLLIVSFACTHEKTESKNQTNNDHLINAVLYHQTSPEYKALCCQSFYLGKIMLDNDLADSSVTKPRAVVVDIDETILDNSNYEAKCIIENM